MSGYAHDLMGQKRKCSGSRGTAVLPSQAEVTALSRSPRWQLQAASTGCAGHFAPGSNGNVVADYRVLVDQNTRLRNQMIGDRTPCTGAEQRRWPTGREQRYACGRVMKPSKKAASCSWPLSGRTCATYWSGRATTMQPDSRSMPRMLKMSLPLLRSGQNIFS